MATQGQVSDFITLSRNAFSQSLDLFSQYQRLAHEAQLTGRVFIAESGVTTNLTPEQFVGANEGITPEQFVAAFAALGAVFNAVNEETAAALFEVK